MKTLLAIRDFRREVQSKRHPTSPVFHVNAKDWPEDVAPRTKRFVFSDGSVDRMGDTIAASGWDLDDFRRNPVILWAHDSSSPPIGRAFNVGVVGTRLMGDIEFAPRETYDFAGLIFDLLDNRFLNAVSVGFLPLKYSLSKDRPGGIDFEEQILLECSVCPVPANPNALSEARHMGIDTRPLSRWAEHELDTRDSPMLDRPGLLRLKVAAREPVRPVARSRAADLATAAGIRFRIGPARRAADLARAAAVKRRVLGDGPDYAAVKVAIDAEADQRQRDRLAGADWHSQRITW